MFIEFIDENMQYSCEAVTILADKVMPEMQDGIWLSPMDSNAGRKLYVVYNIPDNSGPAIVNKLRRIKAYRDWLSAVFSFADREKLKSICIPVYGCGFIVNDNLKLKDLNEIRTYLLKTLPETTIEHIYIVLSNAQRSSVFDNLGGFRKETLSFCAHIEKELQTETGEQTFQQFVYPFEVGLNREADAIYSIPKAQFKLEDSFGTRIDRWLEVKNIRPGEFVQRANISRQTLSKLRSNDIVPEKYTALACAIALELKLNETQELLKSAGYCLSASIKMDVIVAYCIKKEWYDIDAINILLFEKGIRQLGARK